MEKFNISKFKNSVIANSKLKSILGGCTAEANCGNGFVISCSGGTNCSGSDGSHVSCESGKRVEPWPGAGFTVSEQPIFFGCPPQ